MILYTITTTLFIKVLKIFLKGSSSKVWCCINLSFKFPNDIQAGDYVRILKEKKQFQKGYADQFSRQIYHVIQGNGYTFSLQDENGHGLDRKYKYYELSKVTKIEKYLNREADRENPLTNQQKRNRREIEELLEHTVEPLQKKRKINSRNFFS